MGNDLQMAVVVSVSTMLNRPALTITSTNSVIELGKLHVFIRFHLKPAAANKGKLRLRTSHEGPEEE